MSIKIIFFDCDGTLTKVKSSWEYIHRKLDTWQNNADEYEKLFKKGQITYSEFCKKDALLWKGYELSEILKIVKQIPYQEDVHKTVEILKNMGIFTVIISTGLSLIVDRVKKELGINSSLSNELLTENGILTGETKINVEYNSKGYYVEKILKSMNINISETCAIGDGEGDKNMFQSVSLSIGFHPCLQIQPFITNIIENGSIIKMVDIVKNHV